MFGQSDESRVLLSLQLRTPSKASTPTLTSPATMAGNRDSIYTVYTKERENLIFAFDIGTTQSAYTRISVPLARLYPS